MISAAVYIALNKRLSDATVLVHSTIDIVQMHALPHKHVAEIYICMFASYMLFYYHLVKTVVQNTLCIKLR